ncbi:COG4315 family predicted lipoprotein [Cupriavidus sp. CuC1]|uniref:hypothetical protein n=1 Tax=Cupriavidus sp. CuC1 TaxID=3373131 RepID=UPI0037D460CD
MNRAFLFALRIGAPFILSVMAAVAAVRAQPSYSGGILVNADGMTLYVFDRDVAGSGRSAWRGQGTNLWLPARAKPEVTAVEPFSILEREDGTRQWAYKGKPLYLYAGDRRPGERSGDNFKNIWHIVRN